MKPVFRIIPDLRAWLFFCSFIILFSCNSEDQKNVSTTNPAFATYISSYSSGLVSSHSNIRVMLSQPNSDSTVAGKESGLQLFKLTPEVKGSTYWLDANTVEFRPAGPMSSGQLYQVKFSLASLFKVPKELSEFAFPLQVIRQDFDLKVGHLATIDVRDLSQQKLEGEVHTSDQVDGSKVERALAVDQFDKQLPVSWTHSQDGLGHRFVISQITRSGQSSELSLAFNGNSLGVDRRLVLPVAVPALGDFRLTSAQVMPGSNQHVVLQFSDPIRDRQNLEGLIRLGDLTDLQFDIQGHEILVYPNVRQTDSLTLILEPGIRNVMDQPLKERSSVVVRFEQLKPAVRFTGKGNILPGSSELVLPFEAVGLNAVDVQVVKIFEKNILQFLQANQLDGSNELRRVGKIVLQKRIPLSETALADFESWNRYTLDLTRLMETEPGAIYQVRISFKQAYATYFCDNQPKENDVTLSENESWEGPDDQEFSYWDSYESDYYNPDFNWQERDNPCHSSYYSSSRNISRNIMSSDLGIIAKRGAENALMIFINRISDATPLQDVQVEIFNFQKQLLASVHTDAEGKVFVNDLEEKPFVIVATTSEQKGYLRIDDGSSLSLSSFDVSGETVQNGVKGFIYGDRGVWRPGDSLHISFILEDKNDQLPEEHPVIFELVNPQSQVVDKKVLTASVNGIYYFGTATDPSALTGNYLARLIVGTAIFTKTVKIETVKPNRLKIKLDIENGKILAGKNNIRGDLDVHWLHGATARNLLADVEITLSTKQDAFPAFAEYTFSDPTVELNPTPVPVLKERLNDAGHLDLNTTLEYPGMIPGPMNANFHARVFEEGGDFSVDRFTIPFYAYSVFLGIRVPKGDQSRNMLLTDTTHRVEILRVGQDGIPTGNQKVKVEVYKMQWTWWWENSGSSTTNYINSVQNEPIHQETVSLTNGEGSYGLKINYPDWGRYLIRVCDPATGHCTAKAVYVDWPGWAGRAQRDGGDGATMLTFTSDKPTYQIGEEVVLQIPGSEVGRALISIENGSKVLQSWWLPTQAGDTPFRFVVTTQMAPNIYVSVTLLQKHSQTVNDLPIRLYGIIPIIVEDPMTHLKPEIKMADQLQPGKEVDITISESEGRKMSYTVAMVDEGLLDLTRFQTPDPWNKFYAREALGVRTWDLYDQVIGAYGSNLERLLAIGGDETLILPKESDIRAQRFKPVVKFMGPYTLESGRTNSHTFTMPEYIGSVKTMVVAAYDGAYGQTEKVTPVRDPLMVIATLPRVLSPDEHLQLPVTVFAGDASVKNATIEVNVSGPLMLNNQGNRQISFNAASDLTTNFDLSVKRETGIGKVTVTAISGSHRSEYNMEVDVRNPFLPVTKIFAKELAAGAVWNNVIETFGINGSNYAVLEISGIPPLNLEARLSYLISYPHGCLEQTTSAAFPQLYLSQLHELDEQESRSIQDHVKAAIQKIVRLQLRDGGFAYWPGAEHADYWSTTYAGHFLIEAEHKGYVVPTDVIRKWKRYQKRAAADWRKNDRVPSSDLQQAYRLYSLALAGAPENGSMNLLRETPNLQKQASWMLAAAYAVVGQVAAAQQLINRMNIEIDAYPHPGETFGSVQRDQAILLETLSMLDDKSAGISLLQEISRALANNDLWMSTQTTAFCLKAVANFVEDLGDRDNIVIRYSLEGDKSIEVRTALPMASVQFDLNDQSSRGLKVENISQGTLFARVMLTGTPSGVESDVAIERNLKIASSSRDSKGNTIDISELNQGTSFYSEVTIKHLGFGPEYKNLALSQIFPSGWEINNSRLEEASPTNTTMNFNYQDIRDDRVMTYFDLKPGEQKTFKVLVTAAYAGEYFYPGPYCEAMYDHNIQARAKGMIVKVVETNLNY